MKKIIKEKQLMNLSNNLFILLMLILFLLLEYKIHLLDLDIMKKHTSFHLKINFRQLIIILEYVMLEFL
jgi:hypothetical protein